MAQKKPATRPQSCVVYVHGGGHRASGDELKLEWDLALFGRDLGARSRMTYFADLVRPNAKVAP